MDRECVDSIELDDRHELAMWRDILHVWKEQPPGDVLSIILSRPAGSECEWLIVSTVAILTDSSFPLATTTPSSSENSNLSQGPPTPSWLVEMDKKLWGRSGLFGQIFRTANLTENDFVELQSQLQILNPTRSSESYITADRRHYQHRPT